MILDQGDENMSASSMTELEAFHHFVGAQLQQCKLALTPEDALDLFRQQQMTDAELGCSVAAVERALAQADRGEGVGLDEAVQQLREKHGLLNHIDGQ
jgi:hypothetical protein